MSSAANCFNIFVADIGNKIHYMNGDNFNFILTNTAPVATNTVYSNFTELGAGNGYTTGGITIASIAYSQTGGVASWTGANVTWTATGSMGPFRYTPLYNSTASGKNAILWYDYGSSVTLTSGETFQINISGGLLNTTT
jgi:hypothetical protein